MARIAGINIPDNKHARVSLTYIFGIGAPTALKICDAAGVRPDEKSVNLMKQAWMRFETQSPNVL